MGEFWLYIIVGFFGGVITTALFLIEFIKKIIKICISKSNEK